MSLGFPSLNLPPYKGKLRQTDAGFQIYDPYRRKFVVLTPEEWVRQHVASYLQHHLNYPASRILTEASIRVNHMLRRVDVLVSTPNLQPWLVVECKRWSVELTQNVVDQASRYNLTLGVQWIVISNGMNHYCLEKQADMEGYRFANTFPQYTGFER